MSGDRHPSGQRGIRYREHATRAYLEPGKKKRPDRYYHLRHSVAGCVVEEGVGWESEGFTLDKVMLKRAEPREAKRTGIGYTRLSEQHQEAKEAEVRRRQEVLTFADLSHGYLRWAEATQKPSYSHDESHPRLHILPHNGGIAVNSAGGIHI